jgi:preprotein translocase subunit SecA
VLEGADLHEQVRHFIDDVIGAYVEAATSEGFGEDWDLEQLFTSLRTLYPVSITVDELLEEVGDRSQLTTARLIEELRSDAQHAYDRREEQIGAEGTRELERRVVLSVLDRKWREHLYEMDYLQEGISLRAMAQRDPLVEYQREGYQLFQAMTEAIKEESVGYLFNLEVQVTTPAPPQEAGAEAGVPDTEAAPEADGAVHGSQPVTGSAPPRLVAPGLEVPDRSVPLRYSAPTVDGDAGVEVSAEDGATAGAARAAVGGNRAERRARRKR